MARNIRVNITDFGDVVNVDVVGSSPIKHLFSYTEVSKNAAKNIIRGNNAGNFAKGV